MIEHCYQITKYKCTIKNDFCLTKHVKFNSIFYMTY